MGNWKKGKRRLMEQCKKGGKQEREKRMKNNERLLKKYLNIKWKKNEKKMSMKNRKWVEKERRIRNNKIK